jgi:hypothetical protein
LKDFNLPSFAWQESLKKFRSVPEVVQTWKNPVLMSIEVRRASVFRYLREGKCKHAQGGRSVRQLEIACLSYLDMVYEIAHREEWHPLKEIFDRNLLQTPYCPSV